MGPPAAARLPRQEKKEKKRLGPGRASFPQLPPVPPSRHNGVASPGMGYVPASGRDPCGETYTQRGQVWTHRGASQLPPLKTTGSG